MLARTCPSPSVKYRDFAELYVFKHFQPWKPLLILRRSLQPCWWLFAHWSQSKVEKTARIPITSNCITYTVKSCRDLARKHPTVFLPCQTINLLGLLGTTLKFKDAMDLGCLSEVQMCLKRYEWNCVRVYANIANVACVWKGRGKERTRGREVCGRFSSSSSGT